MAPEHTEVELPGMPTIPQGEANRGLGDVVKAVEQSLEFVQHQLEALRDLRSKINVEIKRLVNEEMLLRRMLRASETTTKEQEEGD